MLAKTFAHRREDELQHRPLAVVEIGMGKHCIQDLATYFHIGPLMESQSLNFLVIVLQIPRHEKSGVEITQSLPGLVAFCPLAQSHSPLCSFAQMTKTDPILGP